MCLPCFAQVLVASAGVGGCLRGAVSGNWKQFLDIVKKLASRIEDVRKRLEERGPPNKLKH
jgi:hypothetical protein